MFSCDRNRRCCAFSSELICWYRRSTNSSRFSSLSRMSWSSPERSVLPRVVGTMRCVADGRRASITAHRSATGASARKRPLLFLELVLPPQPTVLILEFLHARSLHRAQGLVRLGMDPPPRIHPVPQGSV